ncbi:MAG: hypothetical protein WCG21_10330 [Eubacteriales bacterium]
MNIYIKSLYTHTYEGSIHVDDLLYLYEKIRTIAFFRYPDFKKIEPLFEISSEQGDIKDLTAQKLENSFSPDEMLTSCSFTLRLPASGNQQQDVTSISFTSGNQQSIRIKAEGTNQQQVDAIVNTIIYKINPYVSDMNKGRQPPVMHEERKAYALPTEPAKRDKPNLGKDMFEAPVIKSNLSDADKERLEKDSRRNSIYILAGIAVIVLFIVIVVIINALK